MLELCHWEEVMPVIHSQRYRGISLAPDWHILFVYLFEGAKQ